MEDMRDWDKTLTALQGYNSMRQFLKAYGTYCGTYSDDIMDLYQKLRLLKNGITADPVASHRWTWCVNQTLTEEEMDFFQLYPDGKIPVYKKIEHLPEVIQDPNQLLTYLQAYTAMNKLVRMYYFDTETSSDLGSLAGSMAVMRGGGTADSAMWEDWLDAVEIVLKREVTIEK